MSETDDSPQLTLVRHFAAPVERVFAAWTKPTLASQWLFTSAESERSHHELEARLGGHWTITDRRDGHDYTATGEYLTVEPPRRLAFTFAMPQFSPNRDRIQVELSPDDDGCSMTFTQAGEDIAAELRQRPAEGDDAPQGGSEAGWQRMFDRLAGVLTRGTGHGRPVAADALRFERLLPGPITRAWDYLVDADKRALWLAGGALEPRVGGTLALHFEHAGLSPRRVSPPARFHCLENGCTTHHQVLRFEPPHGLALSWGGGDEPRSEVTFELSEAGERVRLVVTHCCLEDVDGKVDVAGGWHTHLAILVEVLAGRIPPPFWTLFEGIEDDYQARLDAESGPS